MKKSDLLVYNLTKKQLLGIFIYYSIFLITGIIISVIILIELNQELSKEQIMIKTTIVSLSVSAMLCSLQYVKRLYKACITYRIIECKDYNVGIGNLVYFISRPFFSFVFVIVMIFFILSGMFIVTGSLEYIINERFLYLCAACSSFIGYSVGNVLDKFETLSNKK